MRIALLLDGDSQAPGSTLDAARLVTLPPSTRIANALGSCLGADSRGESGVFVLAPVGAGVLAGDAWEAIERGVAVLDDGEAIEAEIANARRLLDEGWLEAARDAYTR